MDPKVRPILPIRINYGRVVENYCLIFHWQKCELSQLMGLWYLSYRRLATAQANAHARSLARAFAVRTHKMMKVDEGSGQKSDI